jgi:hypothetical protein
MAERDGRPRRGPGDKERVTSAPSHHTVQREEFIKGIVFSETVLWAEFIKGIVFLI